MSSLQDTDFYFWTQQQADLLRSGNLAALDITNLIGHPSFASKSSLHFI